MALTYNVTAPAARNVMNVEFMWQERNQWHEISAARLRNNEEPLLSRFYQLADIMHHAGTELRLEGAFQDTVDSPLDKNQLALDDQPSASSLRRPVQETSLGAQETPQKQRPPTEQGPPIRGPLLNNSQQSHELTYRKYFATREPVDLLITCAGLHQSGWQPRAVPAHWTLGSIPYGDEHPYGGTYHMPENPQGGGISTWGYLC